MQTVKTPTKRGPANSSMKDEYPGTVSSASSRQGRPALDTTSRRAPNTRRNSSNMRLLTYRHIATQTRASVAQPSATSTPPKTRPLPPPRNRSMIDEESPPRNRANLSPADYEALPTATGIAA